jgi:hypothetical protein
MHGINFVFLIFQELVECPMCVSGKMIFLIIDSMSIEKNQEPANIGINHLLK